MIPPIGHTWRQGRAAGIDARLIIIIFSTIFSTIFSFEDSTFGFGESGCRLASWREDDRECFGEPRVPRRARFELFRSLSRVCLETKRTSQADWHLKAAHPGGVQALASASRRTPLGVPFGLESGWRRVPRRVTVDGVLESHRARARVRWNDRSSKSDLKRPRYRERNANPDS